ncbi:unnamed protein product, partial [Durusdinium trenchii]
MDSVSDALANKASSTLHNRAGPLIRFAKFWRDRGCECFPVEEPMLYEYFKSWTNAAPSSFRSLLLSISFAFHILGLMGGEVVLKSGRIKGLSAAHVCNRRKVVQRPPLTVEQVQHLEQIVKDERRTAFDRIAAGYFLLLIFGRLRFSDGLHISSMKLDVITVGTDLEGFLECEAERTKTSITLERKTRHLPIAIPILGFSDPSWVLTWLELRDKAGLKCERGTPLMTSPMADGSWSKTPLPVSSAGEWLRALSKVSDGAAVRIATHSCKSTLLSMCSKFGLEHSVRRMLGYHSCSKDKSLLVYSRDSMSLPLRRLREVIMAVRTDMFFPDKTRSGYFAPGSTCESNQPASDDDGSLDSESRGSESEEGDIPEEEEKAVAQVVGPWRPQEATDSLCYARHKTSRCLHVLADEGGTHFRCGRTANANYLRLDEKPEFVYPACGVPLVDMVKDALGRDATALEMSHYEPGDTLVDKFCNCYESDRYCLVRRGLAMEQANVMSYENHDRHLLQPRMAQNAAIPNANPSGFKPNIVKEDDAFKRRKLGPKGKGGGRRKKNTALLASDARFSCMERFCDGTHSHEGWGFDEEAQVFNTSKEAEYPKELCEAYTDVLVTLAQARGISIPLEASQQEAAKPQKQPRGRRLPQIVSEYGQVITRLLDRVPSLDSKQCLQTAVGDLPCGARLLRSEAKPGQKVLCVFGVYRSMESFVEVSRQLWHPYDELMNLPDDLIRCLFLNLTLGLVELTKHRIKTLDSWMQKARALQMRERDLHKKLNPKVARILKGKRLLVLEELAKDIGWFCHRGAIDFKLSDGSRLKGLVGGALLPGPSFAVEVAASGALNFAQGGLMDSVSDALANKEDDIPEEEEKAVAQVVGPWRPQEATDSLCYARHKTSRCLHVLADEGGHYEPGDTLVDKFCNCYESDRYCLVRRGLAMEQANVMSYENHDRWTELLMETRMSEPPLGYQKVSVKQLEQADKKFFTLLSEHTRSGIKATPAGRPCDLSFDACFNATEVRHLLQPRMAQNAAIPNANPSGFKPNIVKEDDAFKRRKLGPKGKGGGKADTFQRVPVELLKLGGVASTSKGNRICFGFNLKTCNAQAKQQKCDRGLRLCCVKNCFKPHPAVECPNVCTDFEVVCVHIGRRKKNTALLASDARFSCMERFCDGTHSHEGWGFDEEVSRQLWHPYDELMNLPDDLIRCLFLNLTLGLVELTKHRIKTLDSWMQKVVEDEDERELYDITLREANEKGFCKHRGAIDFKLSDGSRLKGQVHESWSNAQGQFRMTSFDLASAYKQLPLHPEEYCCSIVTLKNPDTKSAVCFEMRTLPFGSVASVLHFNRISRLIWALGLRLGILWTNYFDDYPTITHEAHQLSTMTCVKGLFELLGFAFGEEKLAPFGEEAKTLGVLVNLSQASQGKIVVDNKPSRKQELLETIDKVLGDGFVIPIQLPSILGRMQFADMQLAGKMGKEACDAALHRKLKESEDDQPMHRLRAAKDDDGVLIDKRFVMIRLPAFSEPGREFPEISCRVLWQIKGADVWLELTEATLTYVLAALRVSERFVKQKKLRG